MRLPIAYVAPEDLDGAVSPKAFLFSTLMSDHSTQAPGFVYVVDSHDSYYLRHSS